MTTDTWQRLESLFTDHPVMKAEPVPFAEIEAASKELGVPFPADYVEFVEKYGGAVVGPLSVIGLRQAIPMGDEETSIVDVTKRFRSDEWPGADSWAVISVDHSGNPYGLASDGAVWLSDHDYDEIIKVADSFETFLRTQCLKAD